MLRRPRDRESPVAMLGVFFVTALGGLLFSFLYERCGYDLWVPWALHAAMNLAWQAFAVGESASAGWLPTTLQAVVALLAAVLVVRRGPWQCDAAGEGTPPRRRGA